MLTVKTNLMEYNIKEVAQEIAFAVSRFLKQAGGSDRGYDTEINATIYNGIITDLNYTTPISRRTTIKEKQLWIDRLEVSILHIIDKYKVKETVIIRSKNTGVINTYETFVDIVMTTKVTL